jgi:hypothetical protein
VTRASRLLALAALLAGHTVAGEVARADDASCDPPPELGPSEITPADHAMGVPRNAIVRVRYSPGYFAGTLSPTETITLSSLGVPVAGSTQLAGDDTLYFVPAAPLVASRVYTGEASGAVVPFEFQFTTGTAQDAARPDFADPRGSSDFALEASASEGCGVAGGRRVRLTFPAALDDGPPSSIEYWVYLTRAEGLDAPVLLTRIRDYGAPIVTGGFLLTRTQSERAACISVVAVDGLDRATEWPAAMCLDPSGSLGFVGLCTAGPAGVSGKAPRGPLVLFGLALVLAWQRRTRARSLALTAASPS